MLVPALRAKAPKDDLRRFHNEAVGGGRFQARRRADRAVHIGGQPAAAADKVMVVVADPRFVTAGVAGRLNAPDKPRFFQRVQVVIDRLGGKRAELAAGGFGDGFRIPVLPCALNGCKDREPACRDPKSGPAKSVLKDVHIRGHVF